MCLCYDITEPTHQGVKTAWKIVNIMQVRRLKSFYWDRYWLPGLNYSSRESTQVTPIENRCRIISEGFHVYTSKEIAEQIRLFYWRPSTMGIMAVQVDSADFVAEGSESAVYTKIMLSDEEYLKTIFTGE